jgi:CubicO group peptidase (beta-lactamase class C family)
MPGSWLLPVQESRIDHLPRRPGFPDIPSGPKGAAPPGETLKGRIMDGLKRRRWGPRGLPSLLFLPLLAWVGEGAAQGPSGAWEEALARFGAGLAADVARDDVGGITAGVVVGRDLVWAQGFGWADRDRGVPAGIGTIYRVGSISKSFTAVALLQLHERGYLDVDDPVLPSVPELDGLRDSPQGALPMTFRHLASHTAGLIREPELEGAAEGPLEFWEDKLLASIPSTSFYGAPGESYRYSNIGFGILGFAMGRAVDVPFMELVDGLLFRTLGMGSSGFVVTPAMAEHLATGYVRFRDGSIDSMTPYREHVGRGYKVPNGGIYSTVGDLTRFISGLTGSSSALVLGPDGRALIRASQTPEGEVPYSFGFSISRREGLPDLLGHGGSVAGYTAHMVFEPESGIGVILLRNYGGGATDLGRAARDLVWELVGIRAGEG